MKVLAGFAVPCLLALATVASQGAPESVQPLQPLQPAARRGDLAPRLLLTGELQAARAQALLTPATPSFQAQIRWLAEDGAEVRAGAPVVEFDNASFVSQLEEKRRAAASAADDLARQEAEARTNEADKLFVVEQKRTDVAKARIAAAVPDDLLPRREYQDRQLTLERAETELAKAEEDLRAQRAASSADLGVQRVTLEKARREVARAEEAIEKLTLRAPRDGMFLVADHPYDGRKLRESDNIWSGITVATIPDLSSLEVAAALSDVDDGKVRAGMPADCYLDAYPDTLLHGTIVEVSSLVRESGRSPLLRYVPVRVELNALSPRDRGRLRPGMSVRVEVPLSVDRAALLVPRVALDLAANPPRVLLAGGGGMPVRLGACDAFWCQVTGDVRPGQALRRTPAAQAVPAGAPTSAAPAESAPPAGRAAG